jgi:alkyl sulfatase BDS1-like metallo-beta-lactamase superfamily hydrolase
MTERIAARTGDVATAPRCPDGAGSDVANGASMSTQPSFEDRTDFENAERGFVESLSPGVIKDAEGRVVWDIDVYAYLDADCPPSVNPSLWRQARLCAKQGLFRVTDRVYQVRGLDISNMTLVEGERGVIVIDPLISTETAAALALYRKHRGGRPVTGVIYTHSHGDHFGGVRRVLPHGPEQGVPHPCPGGLPGARGQRERLRGQRDGPPRGLHVRREPAQVAGGSSPKSPAGVTLTLTKPQLLGVLAGEGLDGVGTEGDPALLARLFSYLTKPDRAFPIVTP